MLVIDSHAHIYPALGGTEGGVSPERHLIIAQRAIYEHLVQPARNVRTNEIVSEKKLWNPNDPSETGRKDVNFHFGEFGRLGWIQDGVECYIQYFPPTEKDLSCPPDLLKAMMDYAGIDVAVLQCGGIYGNLNSYYAMVLDEYPDLAKRFLPLVRINEDQAYTDSEIRCLSHAIVDLGLRGLWFSAHSSCFGSTYDPFWSEVEKLGIPAFLAFFPDRTTWTTSIQVLEKWIEKYPNIPCVLPQAFPLSSREYNDSLVIPEPVKSLIAQNQLYIELAYPIARGVIEDFPFPISNRAIQLLYDTFGSKKLVWGSDVPMVNRYCTYAQSLTHLTKYCTFISQEDMPYIVGGNLARIFRLT